jgi:hypothetical protein
MRNSLYIILIVFLMALSAIGFLWGVNIYLNEKNSTNWPRTIAIVSFSEIIELKGKTGASYCPKWTYQFFVDGKQHSSSGTAFGTYQCYSQRKSAENELNQHPIGSKISAIYNPDDPSHAALRLSNSGSFFWMLVFVGMLCMTGGTLILSVLLGIPKQRKKFSGL